MNDFPFKKFTFQNFGQGFGKDSLQGTGEHYVKSSFRRGETIFAPGQAGAGQTDSSQAGAGQMTAGQKTGQQGAGRILVGSAAAPESGRGMEDEIAELERSVEAFGSDDSSQSNSGPNNSGNSADAAAPRFPVEQPAKKSERREAAIEITARRRTAPSAPGQPGAAPKQTAESFRERLDSIMREDAKKTAAWAGTAAVQQNNAPSAQAPVKEKPESVSIYSEAKYSEPCSEAGTAGKKTGEARFDEAARERMMYEGSDRGEAPKEISQRAPVADERSPLSAPAEAVADRPRGRQEAVAPGAGQKAYPVRPLTQKSGAQKPEAQKKENRAQAAPQRPRLIGICNQKGGVGKTTTAINLATALAAVGKNVLIIDMDPQGNASTGLGVRRSAIRTSVYDVLFDGADVVEAAVTTRVPGLSVVPSSIHLSGAEIELVTADNRENRLKKALHRPLPFDYVVVDCPPSLNLLTLNALVAVDSILVPLQCEFYALEGLSHLVKTIERVKKSFNPALDIHGIILTMYDLRNKLSAQVEEDVRQHFGDKVYKTVIPRNVRLSEAPSFGLPAIVYDMKSTGAQAYIKLAGEVILRERNLTKAANEGGEGGGSAQVA